LVARWDCRSGLKQGQYGARRIENPGVNDGV
jgi:hypothetical protein